MKSFCTVILIALTFYSCKKTERLLPEEELLSDTGIKQGVPEDPKAHGYFFARYAVSESGQKSLRCVAGFAEQSIVFSSPNFRYNNIGMFNKGEIQLKKVVFDTLTLELQKSPLVVEYFKDFYPQQNILPQLNWHTGGVKNFGGISAELGGGWPLLSANAFTLSQINWNTGYKFFPPAFASNYDSVVIILRSGSVWSRKASTNADSIYFKPSDVKKFEAGTSVSGDIRIILFRYHYGTINHRKYIFETSAYFEKPIWFTS